MPRYNSNRRELQSRGNNTKKRRAPGLPYVPTADVPDLSADMDRLPSWQYSEASRIAGAIRADYRNQTSHVDEKHINQSDQDMLNRCLIKQDNARKALRDKPDAAPYGAVSGFESKEVADQVLQQTLDEHKLSIAAWASKAPTGRRFKMFSTPSEEPIGHGFLLACDKDSGRLSQMDSHQAVLIVEKCDVFENKNGIKLVTFYPDIQEEMATPVEKDLAPLLHATPHYNYKSGARRAFLDSTLNGTAPSIQAPKGPDQKPMQAEPKPQTEAKPPKASKTLSPSEKSYLNDIESNATTPDNYRDFKK